MKQLTVKQKELIVYNFDVHGSIIGLETLQEKVYENTGSKDEFIEKVIEIFYENEDVNGNDKVYATTLKLADKYVEKTYKIKWR